MKGILVDDEAIALMDLERQLHKIGGIEIVGKFNNASDAIEAVKHAQVDVVFLDIDLPEINGLEAAVYLQDIQPAIHIVYVTAYQEFAVKAFELQALDYLLKPLLPERLKQTLQRVQQRLQQKQQSDAPANSPVYIRCFQSMQIEFGPHASKLPWRTNKAQELFAFLIHRRHLQTRKDVLLELLWPHVEPERSYALLYTTIYQLRKTLESADIPIRILNTKTGYSLDLGPCKLDVAEWEDDQPDNHPLDMDTVLQVDKWLDVYRGDYFEEQEYSWADSECRRLRALWYQHAMQASHWWTAQNRPTSALKRLYQIQQRHPYEEEVFFALMKLHQSLGENSFVEQQFALLAQVLHEQFGTEPSQDVLAWYADWKSQR